MKTKPPTAEAFNFLLCALLKKKLKALDAQLEKSFKSPNSDDFKILLGKHALAEELIHEHQGASSQITQAMLSL